jgi:hypothetical protein
MHVRLKCPNCEQTDKGFFEFVGVIPVDNQGDVPHQDPRPLRGVKGLLCLAEGCGSFRPESNFKIVEDGEPAGVGSADPF